MTPLGSQHRQHVVVKYPPNSLLLITSGGFSSDCFFPAGCFETKQSGSAYLLMTYIKDSQSYPAAKFALWISWVYDCCTVRARSVYMHAIYGYGSFYPTVGKASSFYDTFSTPSIHLITVKENMIYVYIYRNIYNLYSYISILITHLDKSNTSSNMFISYETAWFPNSLDLPVAFLRHFFIKVSPKPRGRLMFYTLLQVFGRHEHAKTCTIYWVYRCESQGNRLKKTLSAIYPKSPEL